MRKYESILKKCEKNNGIYETKKYRYVVRYGLYIELIRIEKDKIGTTAALDYFEWKRVLTIM